MPQNLSTYKRYKKSYDAHHKKYVATHRDSLNQKNREKYENDPEFRAKRKAYSDAYRKKHWEECKVRNRNWKRRHPEKIRGYEVKSRYGITDLNGLIASQGGLCAICGEKLSAEKRQIHVDHCHSTDAVRGIVCNNCNLRLGWWEFFESEPEYRGKITSYLEKYRHAAE